MLSLAAAILGLFQGASDPAVSEAEILAKVEEYMAVRTSRDHFSGTILIARAGRPIVRKAFGKANLELDVPSSIETKYRLGSVTKQFTAACILILQERGKLKLSDPIHKYLSSAPKTWDAITIEHLLTHTSGIHNYTDAPDFPRRMTIPQTLDELVKSFMVPPLDFKPGAKFRYSNSGYIVLGKIIEKASGQSYEAFLKSAILDPLGMRDTGYDHSGTILKGRASGYSRLLGLVTTNAAYIDMSLPHAAGSLYSTVDDLLKWDQGLSPGVLLSKASLDAMFKAGQSDYGFGWSIKRKLGTTCNEHGGRIPGFVAMIMRFPAERLLIVVLSNQDSTPIGRVGDDLAAITLGKPYLVPRAPKPIPVAQEILDRYAGEYETEIVGAGKERYTVEVSSGKLQVVMKLKDATSRSSTIAEAPERFYIPGPRDESIEFTLEPDGRVAGFRWLRRNQVIEARRVAPSKPAQKAA